jgi:hypothetical protein
VIRHVVAVVPAHDEAARIDAALDALDVARRRVAGAVTCSIVVVADACTDATAAHARLRLSDPPDSVIDVAYRCVGAARRAGVAAGLAAAGTTPAATWLVSTDADTVVTPDWLDHQLRWAATGVDAVAGTVDLHHDDDRDTVLAGRFTATYGAVIVAGEHPHVHGANLGVRADAYLAVGGWPAVPTGEDQLLWGRLRTAGHRTASPPELTVATSARRRGRAPHGFAADLAALHGTDRTVA